MTKHFDKHAKNYDTVFTNSLIGKAQRDRVYHFLNSFLHKKKLNILELNCGTGEDAHYFSRLGHRVLATDISSEMIKTAQKKYPKINFQQLDINLINTNTFQEKFDFIFSNFGGLNCLTPNELKKFLEISSSILTPNGRLGLVIMPKSCLWEQFYYLLKRQTKNAFRRKSKKFILANVDGISVPTWYFNPKYIKKNTNNYKVIITKPVGIAIPPSYLEPFFKNKKLLLQILIWKEKLLSFSFLAKYADHYLIILQKK